MHRYSLIILGVAWGTSALAAEPTGPAPAAQTAVIAKSLQEVGLDPTAMDKSADPCVDFYQFACGKWNDKTVIPADEASWYRSFDEIQKRNEGELRSLLDALSQERPGATPKTPGPQGKLATFWRACNTDLASQSSGDAFLRATLAKIDTAADKLALAGVIAELGDIGLRPLFSLSVDPDYQVATRMILWLDQGGIGLPDRDDYFRDDDKSKALRAFYVGHLERMLAASGVAAARVKPAAAVVMTLETELARISKTRVERRDPKGLYNRVERKGLLELAPQVPWQVLLGSGKLAQQQEISVTSTAFFGGLSKLWAATSLDDLKTYVRWQAVRGLAPNLGLAWQKEAFALVQQVSGQAEDRPVWRRCLDQTDSALGELLAEQWTEQHFGKQAQTEAERMLRAIVAEFEALLPKLQWMDEATRARAALKAQKMAFLIGRPAVWRQYAWSAGPEHVANVAAGRRAEVARTIDKLGKAVDRTEWLMTPPTVNAYYDPSKNQMVFPAGILQPPFFDPKAHVPVNLGAIGMVIGHELTHGFDDEGSQFDEVGNFSQWWKPSTRKAFDERTACVVRQYSGYAVGKDLHLDGKLTLGENIADIGGLKLALAAYRALRRDAAAKVVADGYDEDQQFFLANAQAWCGAMRPEMERLQVQTNPHSTPRWRVNGPMADLPDFAAAWKCKPGAKLAPVDRCQVW